KIPIDKKVDFHGLSLLDAESLFVYTINSCYKKNLRCILFITGKGVLKNITNEWGEPKLYYGKIRRNFMTWTKKKELSKFILNVEQANIKHGADGAFFVYLRRQKY
ncbi:Smr/MutS family protein, partial [Alphaproteobacteria bacterium]|nr:Smr/MutS family protein [Alphaproteobacteria bacterium]